MVKIWNKYFKNVENINIKPDEGYAG